MSSTCGYLLDLDRVELQALAPNYQLTLARTDEGIEMIGQMRATPVEEAREQLAAGNQL